MGIYDFLKLHFEPYNELYSNIILGCRRTYQTDDSLKLKTGIYNFNYLRTNEITEDSKFIKKIESYIANKKDYYITPNGFKNPKKRNTYNIFTLHNIVIDIDCHISDNKIMDREIDACRFFLDDLFNEPSFPMPNTVVMTGRGIQLWWAIEPLPYKLRYMYDYVRNNIIEKISNMLNDIPTLENMKVDQMSSRNYAGFFRIPGSYNEKRKCFGSYEILNEDKLDIAEFYWIGKEKVKKNNQQPLDSNNDKKTGKYKGNITNLVKTREKMLHELVELRMGTQDKGYRDLMLFILYNAYLSVGKSEEEAWDAIIKLNNEYRYPLRQKDIKIYMSTSCKRKYRITNARIIEMLALSKQECDILNFHEYVKKEIKMNRDARKVRNDWIKTLVDEGKTQMEVARIVGCSQSVVSKALKMNYIVKNYKIPLSPAVSYS